MPLILAATGALGAGLLAAQPTRARAADALRDHGTAFFALVVVAFAVDPPLSSPLAPALDRLSVTWVALGAACAAGGWLAWTMTRIPGSPRSVGFIPVLGLAAPLALWLAMFPQSMKGPAALMPAASARAFFGSISEMAPAAGPMDAIRASVTGIFAMGIAAALAVRHRSLPWAWAAICLLFFALLATRHVRFATYPAAAGIMALPVALSCWTARMGEQPTPEGRWGRIMIMLAFLMPSLLPTSNGAARHGGSQACAAAPSPGLLSAAGGQVVLADPGETPDILYRSRAGTVGALYHRDYASFMLARKAWRSQASEIEPDSVRDTGAGWLLACRGGGRSALVSDLGGKTLWDELERGETPAWTEMRAADPSGWTLWRIRRTELTPPPA